MPYLRDGSSTTDRRLGRLIQVDERSAAYPIRALLSSEQLKTPRSYTWNVGINLDQGAEGACVGFAFAHELAARPVIVSGLTNDYARGIYREAQKLDPWPGGEYSGAVPNYQGTSVLAGVKAVAAMRHYSEYRWAESELDLRVSLGYKGPVVLGCYWYEGMFESDSSLYIRPTGAIVGGHCILVYGVSVSERYYKLWNSWGAGWGIGGACRVTFDDMAFLLKNDGEAVIPIRRKV